MSVTKGYNYYDLMQQKLAKCMYDLEQVIVLLPAWRELLGLSTASLFFISLYLGAEDFTPEQDVEEVRQIEKQVKNRFAIGTQV